MHSTESRILRDRQRAIGNALDNSASRPLVRAARRLVQVYDAGHIPNVGDRFFATHPCDADGAESEGATPTFNCDSSTTLFVDFIRGAPSAGDYAVATAAGGRWVAEKGGTCKIKFCVSAICTTSIKLDGVTITIAGTGLSCVTDSTGCCTISKVPAGNHTVTVTYQGRTIFSGTRTLSCGGTINIVLSTPPSGFECCVGCLIPDTLHLTDGNGTITLTHVTSSNPAQWLGCYTITQTGVSDLSIIPGPGCHCLPPGSITLPIQWSVSCVTGASQL